MTTQTTTNFTELIEAVLLATAQQYGRVSIAGGAENLIAAKVPELCENCGGNISCPTHCGHPNAPSIGQMLGEHQALTALAEYAGHDDMCGASQAYGPITCDCGLDAARAALEAVRGD